MQLIGAIIGYAVLHLTGWSISKGIGTAIGFVVGLAIYARPKDKPESDK